MPRQSVITNTRALDYSASLHDAALAYLFVSRFPLYILLLPELSSGTDLYSD